LTLAVWWRAAELDRRLAAGEDPEADDSLALRARRLTRGRSRRSIADGLASTQRAAKAGSPSLTASVRTRSADVLEASETIATIERRLRAPQPVAPQPVALLRVLLTDCSGPLYQPSAPGRLVSRLRFAAAMLKAPDARD
jgi:hypothetical protein